ncbi:MAG: hypothetical protein RL021_1872, partial [Bacteroidota bacterium]
AALPVFNPGDAGMYYEEFEVRSGDSCRINGWFIPSDDTSADQTLLLVHDVQQSRISLLESVRQFHDRGFNVCAYDLRAHGTSGGKEFSIGSPSVEDLAAVVQLLNSNGFDRVTICGTGISCQIVLLFVLVGGNCDAIVLESPFTNLETYLRRQAKAEWGAFAGWYYPVLARQVQEQLQVPVYQVDLRAMSAVCNTPSLFIAGTADELAFATETYEVYERSAAAQKDLLLVKQARHGELAAVGGAYYYNGISSFVNSVMPRRQKTSSRKRMAFIDDLPGNDRPHTGIRTD